MFSLGALSFAAPWALAGLALLPALWWLLRLTPPIPTRMVFPPIRLLLGIQSERETPAQTPWWLLLLRLMIAAAIVFGAARPEMNAELPLAGSGPVIVVIDNGWAAADGWTERHRVAQSLIDKAARANRRVVLLETAPPPDGGAVALQALGPGEAKSAAAKLTPRPWPVRRDLAQEALAAWAEGFKETADIRWLSDGIASPGAETLAEQLDALGRLHVYGLGDGALVLRLPRPVPDGLASDIERAYVQSAAEYEIRGLDGAGQVLAAGHAFLATGAHRGEALLKAPAEILNRVERIQIGAGATVGAVNLLDSRWRRRPVGLLAVGGVAEAQPLIGKLYYIERALRDRTTVRTGSVQQLLSQPMSMLVLADPGELAEADAQALDHWIGRGGMAVRFAGPALARRTADASPTAKPEPLLPVPLRAGDRVIGGAMSWRQPMALQKFSAKSPFAGLSVPADVRIARQILAQPAPDLAEKTWAALSDGTPLVTAERRGKGWLVLFHTSPNAEWSNLPLSGVFVEMMARLLTLGQGVDAIGNAPPLQPVQTLDAFAKAGDPPAGAREISVVDIASKLPSPQNPPGIYGAADLRRAFNLSAAMPPLAPLDLAGADAVRLGYEAPKQTDLGGWFLAAALILFLIDVLAGLWARGGGRAVIVALMISVSALVGSASAETKEKFARDNS
ncbi:MAG: BatA domain-containing protein, partial [Proteobacteria bacterium]|nr:BatA domain-containing protein [Pseudomonadota bacterium]